MKLPSYHIFWETISSEHLDLQDMALFELAIDNTQQRQALCLPLPYDSHDTKKSGWNTIDKIKLRQAHNGFDGPWNRILPSTEALSIPYSSYMIRSSRLITIKSYDMESWCSKRRIVIPHVSLNHVYEGLCPSQNLSKDLTWDIYNYAANVNLLIPFIPSKVISTLLARFTSIQRFTSYFDISKSDDQFQHLTSLCHKNSIRQYSIEDYIFPSNQIYQGPSCSLLSMHLNCDDVSFQQLARLFHSLNHLESLTLTFYRRFYISDFDLVIESIAANLKSLKHLKLAKSIGKITKLDLFRPFRNSQQQFESFTLEGFDSILAHTLAFNILHHSFDSLQKLQLYGIGGTEDSVGYLLKKCNRLTSLDLQGLDYGDHICNIIAESCPKLEILQFSNSFKLSDVSLRSICEKCEYLRELRLPYCDGPYLSVGLINSVAEYGNRMEHLVLPPLLYTQVECTIENILKDRPKLRIQSNVRVD